MLVNFYQTPTEAEIDWIETQLEGRIKYRYESIPALAVVLPEDQVAALRGLSGIRFVEADGKAAIADIQNTWGVLQIGGAIAHAQGHLGAGVKVAVIDTGVDYTHPELAAVYKGGYDFVFDDNDPMDDHHSSHGTHVSGTIAAALDGVGVVGVAPAVDLYGVKGLTGAGGAEISDLVASIDWTTMNQMDVVNNSWITFEHYATMEAALIASRDAGVIQVFAAGNTRNLYQVSYPAKYPSTIAVSATRQDNLLAGFSERGPAIDFAAPGVGVLSTQIGGQYGELSGTSMAAPHVAGVIALALSSGTVVDVDLDGNLFNEVKDRLAAVAVDLGDPGKDRHFGYGLVNAPASVRPPIQAAVGTLMAGLPGSVTCSGCNANELVLVAASTRGHGYTRMDEAGMLWGLAFPQGMATARADAQGLATVTATVPTQFANTEVWIQVMDRSRRASPVLQAVVQ